MKLRNVIIVCLFSSVVWAENKDDITRVDELTAAYQREILFLSTYKKELESKIQSVQGNLGNKVLAAAKELQSMEKSVVKRSSR